MPVRRIPHRKQKRRNHFRGHHGRRREILRFIIPSLTTFCAFRSTFIFLDGWPRKKCQPTRTFSSSTFARGWGWPLMYNLYPFAFFLGRCSVESFRNQTSKCVWRRTGLGREEATWREERRENKRIRTQYNVLHTIRKGHCLRGGGATRPSQYCRSLLLGLAMTGLGSTDMRVRRFWKCHRFAGLRNNGHARLPDGCVATLPLLSLAQTISLCRLLLVLDAGPPVANQCRASTIRRTSCWRLCGPRERDCQTQEVVALDGAWVASETRTARSVVVDVDWHWMRAR